jgi:4-hydroxythreonine-4-phosphate dehydrogenase
MPLSRVDDDREQRRPILITQGEPSGIGPEIAVKAWIRLGGAIAGRRLRLVGSARLFRETATRLGFDFKTLKDSIIDTGTQVQADPGHPSPQNAPSVTAAIKQSVTACVEGRAAAMVTAPIQKSALTAAGFGFPGHTEFLAELTGARRAVMMLASTNVDPPLRVVPFTIHIPLHDVFHNLDAGAIADTSRIVLDSLARDFGLPQPRLAIAGLNPHAGESGTMGREELDILAPAISELAQRGYSVIGPVSADTMFHADARRSYDAAVCMFHDQALIPIKTLDFWGGVNVTLGLPIVRTSPDHGTALEIAGQGTANAASMIGAIQMASEIAARRGL